MAVKSVKLVHCSCDESVSVSDSSGEDDYGSGSGNCIW